MNKCPYCGYRPSNMASSLKNHLQGHNCPIYDVTKLAENNDKTN